MPARFDLGRVVRLLGCGGVLVVGEVLRPFGGAFGEGQVGHERGGCGAVPVPLAGRCDDDVAGSDPDGLAVAGLDKAFAFSDVERLAKAVLTGLPLEDRGQVPRRLLTPRRVLHLG